MDHILSRSPVWLAVMLALVLVEVVWRVRSNHGYDRTTALTTLGLVAGNIPAAALNAVVLGAVYSAVWVIAPVHLPLGDWRTWAVGFVAVEFAYYWFHRLSHRVRWLWASHAVHHSAEQMTLLSSLRLGWTNLLSAGWLCYVPLVLVGFDPRLVITLLALDLRYQFFLHTEAKISFGPLEWLLNTPAHHRVHHGSNAPYLDRNYGGMVIVFDRLFGTFAAEQTDEPIRYGLVGHGSEPHPIKLGFREWVGIGRDVLGARSLGEVLHAMFAPPGTAYRRGAGRAGSATVSRK